MIEIVNGRVFVEGKETVDPTLIGYAVLDAAENGYIVICGEDQIKKVMIDIHESSFKAGQTLEKGLQSIGIIKQKECSVLPTFTENEIQQLQNKIHKITGDGEVMGLFNELLGVCAG